MCRMIIASGSFSVVDVMNAACAMAAGETVKHEGLITKHISGWGCLWIHKGRVKTLRGAESFIDALPTLDLSVIQTDFLAVHVRHATLSRNRGIEYSHPLKRESGSRCWYMMHNGFLPTVYLNLGLSHSGFDSAEYLEYIVGPTGSAQISEEYLSSKLGQLLPGGTSGNCFLITREKAWAWQWFAQDTKCTEYFTMRHLKTDKVEYISSEIIPFLGDELQWRSMRNGELYEFNFKGGGI